MSDLRSSSSTGAPEDELRPMIASALRSLARLERLESADQQSPIDPAVLDARMRDLLGIEDDLKRRLGALLRGMAEHGAWARLMFDGVGHYAEQRLGLGRTSATDLARVDRALDRHPHLAAAYRSGEVGLEAALLVLRVLGRGDDAGVERAWVEKAARCTVKRLRDEVRAVGRTMAESPGTAEPNPLSDADWYASLFRAPGSSRRRVEDLGARAIATGVEPDVFLRLRLPGSLADAFAAAVESRRGDLTHLADSVPWHEPWPDASAPPSLLAARVFSVRGRRTPAWVGLLALLEEFVAVWDDPAAGPRRKSHAIPSRDGWRCVAPGCTSRRRLEVHHVIYRSNGGSDDDDNRITLCRFHHQRGQHGGLARCHGRAPLGVSWRLGRPRLASRFRNELRIDLGCS
jgi:hypothetical protein